MPGGAARSPGSPKRRSRRWKRSARGANGSPPRSARASPSHPTKWTRAFARASSKPTPTSSRFFTEGPWGKPHFDLGGYVAHRLTSAGIAEVEALNLDTYAEAERFYSYRRATHRGEADYGRQASHYRPSPNFDLTLSRGGA